ncbi:MAG: DUF4942 domain-containing protein [Desulfobulbus sp.]|nr:DUF4942 domain-containing protein [Desulfobulbus sp.]
MFNNSTFYPTPRELGRKMAQKVKGCPEYILEPSAGKADLIEVYSETKDRHGTKRKFSAIEIDPDLRATLRGKNIAVIDHDFLAFNGPDKFDLILMNPPFGDGDKHLLKAIDIMYSGQIVCLLNAETLRNTHTRSRQELAKKLEELGAETEYLPGAFQNAERKTNVEVVLVNIVIERKVEEDLFAGCGDKVSEFDDKVDENYEVANGKHIEELVAEFNQIVALSMETIVGYYQNYKKVGQYIGLNKEPDKYLRTADTLTKLMQGTTNTTIRRIRHDFWRKTLDLPEVKKRMTKKRLNEFEEMVKDRTNMDFTENNIRGFLLNLISGYNDTLTKAVLEVFDLFTIKHCWDDGVFTDNIHYFNGWKTNDAFRVGKKVIIPVYGGHGNGPFLDWMDRTEWKLDHQVDASLRDIDIVMNYFDGSPHYLSISDSINRAFARGQNRGIKSTYFTLTAYKKGTLHLTFNDENILRRFNVAACLGREWLPMNYGQKSYHDMSPEEQTVVDAFEIGGAVEYTKNLGQAVFESTWTQPLLLKAA